VRLAPGTNVRGFFFAAVELISAVVVFGCGGGIPIDEEAVFQAQKTVTPATFERSDSALKETFFGENPELHGWFLDRDASRCTAIFIGGQRFHMVLARSRVESYLDRLPVDVLLYDYRGYGRSGGEPTVEGLKSDALAAYEHATDALEVDCVVVHGHSLGTFLATWLASRREVDGLVLEAPVVSADRFVKTLVPWFLRIFIGFDIDPAFKGENNAERIARVEAPTLIVAGRDDEVAPPAHAREIKQSAAGKPTVLSVLEGRSHNDIHLDETFAREYRELLCEIRPCSPE